MNFSEDFNKETAIALVCLLYRLIAMLATVKRKYEYRSLSSPDGEMVAVG
jgi:hypothetical protein